MNHALATAGLLGATAVLAGAFGAHSLDDIVTSDRLEIWRTAAQYHLIHSVVMLVISLLDENRYGMLVCWATIALASGIVLFSFSLYALVLTDLEGFAMVTPLGGVLLIGSWLLLAYMATTSKKPAK